MALELEADDLRFLRRIEQGDREAAAEFFTRNERHVRQSIQRRLNRMPQGIRRLLDSIDIWQSAVEEFWIRTQAGIITAESEDALGCLLGKMALDKLLNRYKALTARCRDVRRTASLPPDAQMPAAPALSSGGDATLAEKRAKIIRNHLPHEMHSALLRRLAGASWSELAEEAGASSDAYRKRIERGLAAVRRELQSSPASTSLDDD